MEDAHVEGVKKVGGGGMETSPVVARAGESKESTSD
jgi:hypothetical protein